MIGELEALVAEHPYREPLWIQLITAYYLSERQSDALDAFQRLKTTLADDLGIDPGRRSAPCTNGSCARNRSTSRKAAQTTAVHKINTIDVRTAVGTQTAGRIPTRPRPGAAIH